MGEEGSFLKHSILEKYVLHGVYFRCFKNNTTNQKGSIHHNTNNSNNNRIVRGRLSHSKFTTKRDILSNQEKNDIELYDLHFVYDNTILQKQRNKIMHNK